LIVGDDLGISHGSYWIDLALAFNKQAKASRKGRLDLINEALNMYYK
jgi:hypothetical protein